MSDTSTFPRFSRRSVLRALLGGAVLGAPAFSALAQGETSTEEVEGRGVASSERLRFGGGPLGIAMFVPPAEGMYRRATNALVDGARAAQARDGSGITVEVVEVDLDLVALRGVYDELQQRGFSMVIGPLTRDAVALIADAGAPPLFTLALNQSEGHSLPPNMLSLGLSIESEARQAASIAYDEAALVAPRPRAALVQDDTPLGARSAAAFAERWRSRGGEAYESMTVSNTSSSRMRSKLAPLRADVHFVAGQPVLAQAVRVALGPRAAIYGTSSLNTGAVLGQPAGAFPLRSPELAAAYLAQEDEMVAGVAQIIAEIADGDALRFRLEPEHAARMLITTWESASVRAVMAGADQDELCRRSNEEVARVAQLLLEAGPAV